MRVSRIKLSEFRRFADLEIKEIPETAKLVILAGPNGSGKSSLFDALLLKYRNKTNYGWQSDNKYYNRNNNGSSEYYNRISIETHRNQPFVRGSLYIRSAYRQDPEFKTRSLKSQDGVLEKFELKRLIENDTTVSLNYERLASKAMIDVFIREKSSTTMGEYRDSFIREIKEPLKRLFPDLVFSGIGNPLEEGTFLFTKGLSKEFDYKNLSGGEKAAFDLILDFAIKRDYYSDAIYCIDEPEIHLNTRIQSSLLDELFKMLPSNSQLWIASHSIGMMRKARDLYDADPGSVVFLDFTGHNFDQTTILTPSKPTRTFWKNVMNVALDDLSELVAPSEVVICEGNPIGSIQGKNSEHDAIIYSNIFSEEFPDVLFISAGSSNKVTSDFLGFAAALPKIATGIKVRRLIDRDDHAPEDVRNYNQSGISVLGRRHIEAYLYDDEVLIALANSVGKSDYVDAILEAKKKAIDESVKRKNPNDDVKSAAGKIYTEIKSILELTRVGNDVSAFARNVLSPLIRPGMNVYQQLKNDIFNA